MRQLGGAGCLQHFWLPFVLHACTASCCVYSWLRPAVDARIVPCSRLRSWRQAPALRLPGWTVQGPLRQGLIAAAIHATSHPSVALVLRWLAGFHQRGCRQLSR